MKKSKFTFPKCPYCKEEYQEGVWDDNNLMRLAREGFMHEATVRCKNCKELFLVTIHISYYGSKIK